KPTYAETGFGYIERGEPLAGTAGYRVLRFTEKPGAAAATEMVQSGRFYWNSGMFCFRASAFLAELEQHAPEMLKQARSCWEAARIEGDRADVTPELFDALDDISIDYAVMEKSN